ncbi:MAG: alpha/beta fold hydrolase [Dehalococcoidia bacterium]
MDQKLGFCTTDDGVRICYATVGQGPPLVKAPNWLAHLGLERHSPVWRHWWEELSKDHTLVRFDQRGSGLSDWEVEDLSFETWVKDLEAVVDALELEQFDLLGISQGGPVGIEYTARHPERVKNLVLYGAYARGSFRLGQPRVSEQVNALVTLTRIGWGRNNPLYRQLFASMFLPEGTDEQMDWFNELQRMSTTPNNAANIIHEASCIDVLESLPNVSVPTLIMHCRHDSVVRMDFGRQLEALIPNSSFVVLEGRNHLLLESEPAWAEFLKAVRAFLSGSDSPVMDSPAVQPPVSYPDGLTQREVDVLKLVATGKTDREIAQALTISVGTASTHVRNLLNKTGTANRTEATLYAAQHGLV